MAVRFSGQFLKLLRIKGQYQRFHSWCQATGHHFHTRTVPDYNPLEMRTIPAISQLLGLGETWAEQQVHPCLWATG